MTRTWTNGISERLVGIDYTNGTLRILRYTDGSNVAEILTERWDQVSGDRLLRLTNPTPQGDITC